MTLPFKGNPAKCPHCGGNFKLQEGLAVGMPMRKLQPGNYAICVDCWSLSITDDGENLRPFEETDIPKMGKSNYDKVQAALKMARDSVYGKAKA